MADLGRSIPMRKPPPPPSMEAQHSQSAGREGPGREAPPPPAEHSGKSPEAPPPSRRHHPHRHPKRLLQPASPTSSGVEPGAGGWQPMETPAPHSSSSPAPPPPLRLPLPLPGQEIPEGGAGPQPPSAPTTTSRRERKPPKPGKYVCSYCGRPCAKPSVLQKHIRSHTGERPYPCSPCGFSFKTKSNLYKHRKSHAHRIKAGLASSGHPGEPEEPTEGESTDSEEETGQHAPPATSSSTTTSSIAQEKQKNRGGRGELLSGAEDSHAVKQRLAMRLSERKRLPAISPDDSTVPSPSSSLGPGSSKGSTESGYFSRSGSAELSQVSPPNASAKTYAEIILGKYGRLGQQQRPSRSPTGLGAPDKTGVPFSVPKTQVIEHITKLITINEAVVDTSEIDSVKPRRSSLSRRSSIESPKFSTLKEPYTSFDPKKGEASGPSGAPLSLGGFPGSYPKLDPVAPLLRSQSMPSSAGTSSSSSSSHRNIRLSQSFDEQQAVAAELRTGSHHRMLRRQPAIEVPLGAEFIPEEAGPSSSSSAATAPPDGRPPPAQVQQHRRGPRVYECEACGSRYKKHESLETHRRCFCASRPPQEHSTPPSAPQDRPQMMHYKFRAMAMAVRKRRKEESLEEDPPSPGPAAITFPPSPGPRGPPTERERKSTWKEISVIQHTSSFEKQDSLVSMESQEKEEEEPVATQTSSPLPREDVQPPKPAQAPLQQPPSSQQQPPKPHPFSRLVRQHNIQVPEILVTEEPDTDMVLASPPATASSSTAKEPEKVSE